MIKGANSLNMQRALRNKEGALNQLKNGQRTETGIHRKRRVNES